MEYSRQYISYFVSHAFISYDSPLHANDVWPSLA